MARCKQALVGLAPAARASFRRTGQGSAKWPNAASFSVWGADVQENPHRQPRRNSLPHHQDGAPHGHQDRRRLFGSRQERAPRRNGGRGGRHRPARRGSVLSLHRKDRRRLQAERRGRCPSGLRVSLRARGLRPCARQGECRVHRPQPQGHRGDGRQDRIEEIRQRGQGFDRAGISRRDRNRRSGRPRSPTRSAIP